TRTQVVLGQVTFTASSDGSTPAYTLTADDGSGGTANSTAVISFTPVNDPPVLAVNNLTLNEGDTITLTGANFQATDEETSNPAQFT
ncbi:cadherin-like domain-containing protein, partial [Haemophilus parainfluenzae]|uniref:cadherin-like domain-containing protein n=1 Tax=Haemophilus parainfluenzae TaxID=729 RepID=UPI00124B81D7